MNVHVIYECTRFIYKLFIFFFFHEFYRIIVRIVVLLRKIEFPWSSSEKIHGLSERRKKIEENKSGEEDLKRGERAAGAGEVRTIEIVGAKLSHEFPAEPIDGMGSAERKRTINESFRGSDRSFNSTLPRLRLRDYSAPSRKVVARIAADPRPT